MGPGCVQGLLLRRGRGYRHLRVTSLIWRRFVSLEDVIAVNDLLRSYVEWWGALDALIQVGGLPCFCVVCRYRWWGVSLDQRAVDVCDHLSMAAPTRAGYGQVCGLIYTWLRLLGDGVRRGTLPPWHGRSQPGTDSPKHESVLRGGLHYDCVD